MDWRRGCAPCPARSVVAPAESPPTSAGARSHPSPNRAKDGSRDPSITPHAAAQSTDARASAPTTPPSRDSRRGSPCPGAAPPGRSDTHQSPRGKAPGDPPRTTAHTERRRARSARAPARSASRQHPRREHQADEHPDEHRHRHEHADARSVRPDGLREATPAAAHAELPRPPGTHARRGTTADGTLHEPRRAPHELTSGRRS